MNKRPSIKSVQHKSPARVTHMRRALLEWYDKGGRSLPWRIRPEDRARGIAADPYAVWLSEIMLQQTTVAHATPYWRAFLERFPAVTDLARAERDEVLAMWAGLGYYARARNLHKCAGVIADEHGGVFPATEAQLLTLPGIGPYTAATIAAICFDEATNIVDGNVERVISRIFAVENLLPKARRELRGLAATLAPPRRAGDYGQALMDLGATICTPRSPKCGLCVWQADCKAFSLGAQTDYPKKLKKAKLPLRHGAVFVLRCGEKVLLQRRPDKGLLGGMMGVPGTPWGEKVDSPLTFAPLYGTAAARNWQLCPEPVRHVFTHFELRLTVYRAEIGQGSAGLMDAGFEDLGLEDLGEWADLGEISSYALPSVMRKVLLASQAS